MGKISLLVHTGDCLEVSVKKNDVLVHKINGAKLEGRMEGELQKQKEIASNMKKPGLDILLISKATGLTVEEIRKL